MGDLELIEVAGKVVGYAATLVTALTPLIVACWTLTRKTAPPGSIPGVPSGELRADAAREVDHAHHGGAEAITSGRPKRRRTVSEKDRRKRNGTHP